MIRHLRFLGLAIAATLASAPLAACAVPSAELVVEAGQPPAEVGDSAKVSAVKAISAVADMLLSSGIVGPTSPGAFSLIDRILEAERLFNRARDAVAPPTVAKPPT